MTLMASETKTVRRPPTPEPMIIVGCQREKTPEGRRKLNISAPAAWEIPLC